MAPTSREGQEESGSDKPWIRTRLWAYGLSLAALVTAVLVRWLLDPIMGDTLPLVTLFGAVAAAVWSGGYRPAYLVGALGYLACNYLFIEPRGTLSFDGVRDLVGLLAYLITCSIIIAFGEAMRVSQRRFDELARQHDELFLPSSVTVESIRRKHNLRDVAVLGFGLTLAVLLVGAMLGFVELRRLSEKEREVAHTHEVMGQLETVLSTLTDAETRQRGYLLVQDEKYLQPYEAALHRVAATVAQLEALTSDNPEQQVHLAGLEQKVGGKLDELKRTVALVKAGDRSAALRIVHSDEGKALMDEVRHAVSVMRQTEEGLLRRRAHESERSFRAAVLSVVLPALIGAVLLGLVFYLSRRSLVVRQRAAEVLGEQRERLRVTLASIGDAVITTDAEGRISYLNAVAESVTGWSEQDARGRPLDTVFRILNEQSREPAPNPATRVLRDGVIAGLANHTLLVRKDGTEVPIDDSAAPIRSEAGGLIGCVLVFRDISARRRAERQLWDSRELLRITLASIGDAVIATDAERRITFLNGVAESVTGWNYDEASGQPLDAVFRIVNEQTRDTVESPVARALREGVIVGLANHTLLIRKDGSELPIDDSAAPIRSETHGVVGCVLVFRDISQRRKAEAQREELLVIAERARGEAEAALATIDRIQSITEAALLDLPFDQLLRELVSRASDALASDTATLLLEDDGVLHVRAAVGLEEEVRARVAVPLGAGFAGHVAKERRPVVLNEVHYDGLVSGYFRDKGIRALAGVPLLSGEGVVLGVLHVGSIRERTFGDEDVRVLQLAAERVALAVEHAGRVEAQRRAREDAEASNRAKDEFLAMLGHELRNPLSAVRNAVATASLDESRRPRALEIARRQAEQLGRLIDDLLDVARITQGRITLRKERVHLNVIIDRAVEATRSFIESRGLRLTIAVASDPIRLEADPARLEQVVANVLTNAAKYTEAGGRIDLTVERQGEEALVRVRDTGIGIAAEMLPRIWDLFTQADRAPDRAQGGLGIGLTVARRLVELHGGHVEAHSEGLGKGAAFVVRLPALPPSTTEEARPAALAEVIPQKMARVLLVEDSPDAAESTTMLLELLGHRVRAVHDGVTALDAARANVPDVMIVDIGLPGMDGYEVARCVRRDPDLKQVVLVALTGYGREEDKQQALLAGFDYHLVKPVSPDALNGLVSRLGKPETEKKPPTVH